jgi:hypothetical protein
MDTPRICISKKATYIGIFVFLVAGYLVFNTLTLQSNQANNSRAAEPTGQPSATTTLRPPGCYAETYQMCLYPSLLNKTSLSFNMTGNAATLFDSVKTLVDDNSKVGIAVYYKEGSAQRSGVVATLTGADIKNMNSFSYSMGDLRNSPALNAIMHATSTKFVLFYVSKETDPNATQQQGMACESKGIADTRCDPLHKISTD